MVRACAAAGARQWPPILNSGERTRDEARASNECGAKAARSTTDRSRELASVGPLPFRARLGDGPRGLQPPWRSLGTLQPRPGALARLSLERGWARWTVRRAAAVVFCTGAVERPRPDSQRACLRPDGQ